MTTDWTFGGLWPYEPRWFPTPEGDLHYVDVGPRDGRPVVLLHGNPTWGFLYRKFIPPLVREGYRVIVPDHLGFGRSAKPNRSSVYAIPAHIGRLDSLLESLDLRGAVVVPQDWGGPMGIAWAVRHPERVGGLFVLNTAAHNPVGRFKIPFVLQMMRAPLVGELLVKGLSLFHHGFLFRAGLADPKRLGPEVKAAYMAPHPSWSTRAGVLAFPRAIPVGPHEPDWEPLALELEAGMAGVLKDVPVKIVWAMKDPSFGLDTLEGMWLKSYPDAPVVKLDDASHYLQEDAPEQIIPELLGFLDQLGPVAG